MNKNNTYKISVVILSLLTLMGVGAWGYQLTLGLGVTGLNNAVSWGSYITMFMFFEGLSAGGLIVASSAMVFNIPAFKILLKPAVILSTVCIILAGIFIIVDIGSPERLFYLILHAQFKSPLMWDVVIISTYLAINLVYLYLIIRKKTDSNKLKVISAIALPIAILVNSVTAWFFGLQIAHESWHTALMAPLFVASALDSGIGLLIIVLVVLSALNIFKVEKKLITSLAGLLVTCVAVDAYFIFSEMITLLYPGEAERMVILNELTKGSMAPFFWGEVILGFAIPLIILLFRKNRENTKLVILSSIFVVFGVFFKRVWLLFTAFRFPNIEGGPGITIGKYTQSVDPTNLPTFWTIHGNYTPTMIEIMVIIGMLSFGIILFTLLVRSILIEKPIEKEHSNESHLFVS